MCFLSKDVHGTLLYDNYLLDVPAMLDLCLLFGSSDRRNLAKLLQNITKCQPKYTNDLQSTSQMFVKVWFAIFSHKKTIFIKMILQALKDLEQYFGGETGTIPNAEPLKLSNISPASRGDIKDQRLEDYVLFLIDIVTSVNSLLEILPAVLMTFVASLPEIEWAIKIILTINSNNLLNAGCLSFTSNHYHPCTSVSLKSKMRIWATVWLWRWTLPGWTYWAWLKLHWLTD